MKIDKIKFALSIILCLLLGFVCQILAPTTGARNWISFFVTSITLMVLLVPALGLRYDNARKGVLIKVASWIFCIVAFITSICFACTDYKIDIYVAVSLLLAVIGWVIIYSLFSRKESSI